METDGSRWKQPFLEVCSVRWKTMDTSCSKILYMWDRKRLKVQLDTALGTLLKQVLLSAGDRMSSPLKGHTAAAILGLPEKQYQ